MNTKILITSLSGIALAMSFSLAQAETSEIEIVNSDIEFSILAELDQQDVQVIEQEEMQATVGTRHHHRLPKRLTRNKGR